eukprot:TRINITY_DN7053_c0_g3_i1.p1 TRINITY_DN7053_c0_g3~~TRINITY_DN7053_c0_g3_i1.p1  ORF type:complete len:591 (-),score=122.33 TRINITY_DN7053_c0_g3_i1:231-1973(-)
MTDADIARELTSVQHTTINTTLRPIIHVEQVRQNQKGYYGAKCTTCSKPAQPLMCMFKMSAPSSKLTELVALNKASYIKVLKFTTRPLSNNIVITIEDFDMVRTIPIKGINPYMKWWRIKARVAEKDDEQIFTRGKGGKLQNLTVVDEGGETRATFFNEAIEKYSKHIEAGKLYFFEKGRAKFPTSGSVKSGIELTFFEDAVITGPLEEDNKTPQIHFSPLRNIAQLSEFNKGVVDVIGALVRLSAPAEFKTKKGETSHRLDFEIQDLTNRVQVTFWGKEGSDDFYNILKSVGLGSVIAVKACKVYSPPPDKDDGKRSLTLQKVSKIYTDPTQSTHMESLRQQLTNGQPVEVKNISRGEGDNFSGPGKVTKTLIDCEDKKLNDEIQPGKSRWVSARGLTIINMHYEKPEPWYNGCSADKCSRKAEIQEDGTVNCVEHKGLTDTRKRYMLRIDVADHTQTKSLTVFGDTAQGLLGMPVDELVSLKDKEDGSYERVFTDKIFTQWDMGVKIQKSQPSDFSPTGEVKLSAGRATKVDFKKGSAGLLRQIEALELEGGEGNGNNTNNTSVGQVTTYDEMDGSIC